MKAEKLARALNVRLISVVSYYENDMGLYGAPKYIAMGMGVQAWARRSFWRSQDVSMNVSITEIAPY